MVFPLIRQLRFLLSGLIVFISLAAHAEFKIEDYKLTESQKKIIYAMIKNNRPEEQLHKMAKLLEKSKPHTETKPYIPEHTLEELIAVSRWSAGGAFRLHAQTAGFKFDFETYMKDCPNMAIFNYGRATGSSHLRQDVMQSYINAMFALDRSLANSPETFSARYVELAKAFHMEKYISPLLTP